MWLELRDTDNIIHKTNEEVTTPFYFNSQPYHISVQVQENDY